MKVKGPSGGYGLGHQEGFCDGSHTTCGGGGGEVGDTVRLLLRNDSKFREREQCSRQKEQNQHLCGGTFVQCGI